MQGVGYNVKYDERKSCISRYDVMPTTMTSTSEGTVKQHKFIAFYFKFYCKTISKLITTNLGLIILHIMLNLIQ